MTISTYLSFAVSPLLIVLIMAYIKFKFSIQTYRNLFNAMAIGGIGVLLLLLLNYLAYLQWEDNLKNMRRMAFFVFVVVAFGSEFPKFLVLRYGLFKLKHFQSPLEGIIYAVFISLGFTTIATLLFAFDIVGTSHKFNDPLLFLYTYPLASIVTAICMCFFVGMGKLRKNRLIDSLTGLGAATFFHGLFYFCFITSDKRLLLFTTIGFVLISITLIVKAASLRSDKDKG